MRNYHNPQLKNLLAWQLGLPPEATWSHYVVDCKVKLGHKEFNNPVIVCHNMHCPLILGEDFLGNNALGVYYDGKWHLEYKHNEELITSIDTKNNPRVMLRRSCTIPGRYLAVLNVWSTTDKQHEGRVYDVQVDEDLSEEHPNLIVIPSLHWVECVYYPS